MLYGIYGLSGTHFVIKSKKILIYTSIFMGWIIGRRHVQVLGLGQISRINNPSKPAG